MHLVLLIIESRTALTAERTAVRAVCEQGDRHEVLGQVLRIVVAGPGSLTGRYPVGITGDADASAVLPMQRARVRMATE